MAAKPNMNPKGVSQPRKVTESLANHICYTDDWKRTNPDYVLFLPQAAVSPHGDNEHLIVVETPGGNLLATWATGTYESSYDSYTVFSRSSDGGNTWSGPEIMPGTNEGPMLNGRWGWSVVSKCGRIYFFFNKCVGFWSTSWTTDGLMECLYSDDDGRTWTAGTTIPFHRREKYDHADPKVPCGWIVWQPSVRDSKGRVISAFTRWSSMSKFSKPTKGFHMDSRSELMRFDNIDKGPHPKDLRITWLPEDDSISVACPIEPEKSKGYSLCEEPAVVLLSDGRLLMIVRTVTGYIWYTVSDDDGASWRPTEVLRYYENGPKVPHPKDTAPLYRLSDGRYLLFYHNHDGYGYGASGPWDMDARRPMFLAVGEFRPDSHQPIWFSDPKLLYDSDGVKIGPGSGEIEGGRFWLSMYGTFIEHKGQRQLWYPDRKHFLLGKRITDEILSGMNVPARLRHP